MEFLFPFFSQNIVDLGLGQHIAASEPKTRLEQDRHLKRKFQITSDVKICLQRITFESSEILKKGPRFDSVNKRTLDGIRKLMQGSRVEMKKKSLETQVTLFRMGLLNIFTLTVI